MSILETLKLWFLTTYMAVFQKTSAFLNKFLGNRFGEVQKVVSIVIALFVAGVLLPIALTELAGGNYTGVNPAVKTVVVVLLPILAVISIVYIFLKKR